MHYDARIRAFDRASPTRVADEPPPPTRAECEAMRHDHVNTESILRAMGALSIVAGLGFAWFGISLFPSPVVYVLAAFAGAAVSAVAGLRLWRLQPGARRPMTGLLVAVALSEIQRLLLALESRGRAAPLSGSPAETIIVVTLAAAALYVLWSGRATTVLTASYRDVVMPSTPHVRLAATPQMMVFLLLLGATLAGAVVHAWSS